ncbi:hypothetical protein BGZ72_009803 [Mortierella alpina]|nr:hypothetical protein BGZ72_009803 [Mortierella alpina]
MEMTQSFRLIGSTDIEEITCHRIGEQNVVYWEDIEQVFPGVKHAKNGNVTASMMRDKHGFRIMPYCIKHYPDVVLDIVLSPAADYFHVDSPLETPGLARVNSRVDTTTNPPVNSPASPPATASANGHITGFSNSPIELCRHAAVTDFPHVEHPWKQPARGYADMSPADHVSELVVAEAPTVGSPPTEPYQARVVKRATALVREDAKAVTDAMTGVVTEAMIASNRTGIPADASKVLAIVEENLPAEYGESIVTLWTVVRELKALHEQGAMTQQIALRVWELQKQMNDRLILIERKTAAILTQNYELLEFTIPRLFIVLPEDSPKWDPKKLVRTKFRLRFICECGEHTMPLKGNRIPHHLHLADHEGYVVNNPTEFFKKYGPFVMLMLEMLKFGTGVAGYVVPALASLKVVDIVDTVQSSMDSVTSKVIQGIDYSLSYLEESCMQKQQTNSTDESAKMSLQDLVKYLSGIEGLEGADLRQLGSYLTANNSDNLLGNLFRMTTKDGHVKWVCREHYRACHEEELTQKLRDVVKLAGGTFDEQIGRIEISLRSSLAAAEFYDAIRRAKGVLDLCISLQWHQERADFVKFKDMIARSKIRLIRVVLFQTLSSVDDKHMGGERYDPILELVRLPFVLAVEVDGLLTDFFRRSIPLPKETNLSKMRLLGIRGQWSLDKHGNDLKGEIATLKSLVSKAPNLKVLHLDSTSEQLPAVFSAITKYQTYTIDFRNLSLRLSAPTKRHTKADVRNLEHICRMYGAQFETLDLKKVRLDDSAMDSLAKALRNESSLQQITLEGLSRSLGDGCIKSIANIVAQCELRKLRLDLETEVSRAGILESVQWKSLRELDITLHEGQGVRVLTVLADGINRMSGSVDLERLSYTVHRKPSTALDQPILDPPTYSETGATMNSTSALTSDQEELLRSVMSLLSLEQLAISFQLSLVQVLALLQSVNFDRLQHLSLRTGFLPTIQVQRILDSLHNAAQLQTLALQDAYVTDEMKEQMLAKGITLTGASRDNTSAQLDAIQQALQSHHSKVAQPSLVDVQSALKTYYEPDLAILRVSGDVLDLETCFVNLAIVEAAAQREKDKQDLKEQAALFHRIPSSEAVERANMMTPIPLEQLFDKRKLHDGKEDIPRTILVQGRAGVGKTTLCKKLVHAHQSGLWKDRFDAVLWLPLRQIKAFKSRTLEGLLREKFFTQGLGQADSALAHELGVYAQQGRVLFVLDGLDEIAKDTQREDSYALKGFLSDLLRQQHVVITSRPSGVDRSLLPPSIDLELEIIGFSPQNVQHFLSNVLELEAVKTLQAFIQRTPLIQGPASIPVQLDVICSSWDSLPPDGPAISTTGLYQLMVRKLWCKDALRLRKSADGVILTRDHINHLYYQEIDELMAMEMQHLGYLAFRGLTNYHQIEFDKTSLLCAFRDLKNYSTRGNNGYYPSQLLEMMKQTSFLHTADADLDTSTSDSRQAWYFLHLTFQDYFAATWVALHLQQPISAEMEEYFAATTSAHQLQQPLPAGIMTMEQAKNFVQEHKYNPRYEIMWWMVAGLLEGEALKDFFDILLGAPRDLTGGRHQQILASCLNEARARLDTTVVTRLEAELMSVTD